MIFWDGKERTGFLKIAEKIEGGETVEIRAADGSVKTVSTFADLRKLLPLRNEQTELSPQEYEEVLQTFMPSEEMREHLLQEEPGRAQMIGMILGSPVSLAAKAALCRRLSARDDVLHQVLNRLEDENRSHNPEAGWLLAMEEEQSFSRHAENIQTALDELALKSGEILLFNEAWFDEETMEEDTAGASVPFLSLDAALGYLRAEMQEEGWGGDSTCWTVLEKWVPGRNGEMEHTYNYYLIRDEIVLFEKLERDEHDAWFWHPGIHKNSGKSMDLNLSVPYQPGDIVKVDCRPFTPVSYVLLLEVGSDCCGVSCLYRTHDGYWDTGALKHRHFMESYPYPPLLSPLYRIASYGGYLTREGRLMKTVQRYIGGSMEKGRHLWEEIHKAGHRVSDRELLQILGYDSSFDEAAVLLTYNTKHQIRMADIKNVLGSISKDVKVRFQHEYDDELLFLLQRTDARFGYLVVWDKEKGTVIFVRQLNDCLDAVRYQGVYYWLAGFARNTAEVCLRVCKLELDLKPQCIYQAQLNPLSPWADVRLQVVDGRLFLVLNGKRLTEIAPDDEIEAGE